MSVVVDRQVLAFTVAGAAVAWKHGIEASVWISYRLGVIGILCIIILDPRRIARRGIHPLGS